MLARFEDLEKIEETQVVKRLLRAVSNKFVHIASAIEKFGDLKKMTLEEVMWLPEGARGTRQGTRSML